MSDDVKPALTTEEWTTGAYIGEEVRVQTHRPGADGRPRISISVEWHPVGNSADLHAVAARALWGQPYGFTHAQVESTLRVLAFAAETMVPVGDFEAAQELILRVCALLPPREGETRERD
jgi:hypothetical protein